MTSDQRSCRILVVDDHEDTRAMMVRLLSKSYLVSEASSYEAAIQEAAEQVPHVVVTDIGLSGASGITLMSELSQRYGVQGIAVTGHAVDDADALKRAGFIAHFLKPINFEQLSRAICDVCSTPAR